MYSSVDGKGTTMRVSIVTVVGLLVATFAFWIGDAESQHGAGKGKAAPPSPPRKVAAAIVPKAHPPQPQPKAHPKAKAAVSKEAQKKAAASNGAQKKQSGSPKQENKAKKNQAHTKKAATNKVARAAGVPALTPQDSIALLNTAYQKLKEVNNGYGGHPASAMKHVGAALGHLGSPLPLQIEGVSGLVTAPRTVSDASLRQARASLEKVSHHFAANSVPTPGSGAAHRAVNNAIRELDAALITR